MATIDNLLADFLTQKEAAAELKVCTRTLDRWRTLAHRRPLAEVLWQIYDETGYLAFCAGLEDGDQRVAKVIARLGVLRCGTCGSLMVINSHTGNYRCGNTSAGGWPKFTNRK